MGVKFRALQIINTQRDKTGVTFLSSSLNMSGSRVPVTMRDFFFDDPFFKNTWEDSKSRWENGWMFPRRWMLPALNTDLPSNMDIFKDKKDNEVITAPKKKLAIK